jgi:hypothetical protein
LFKLKCSNIKETEKTKNRRKRTRTEELEKIRPKSEKAASMHEMHRRRVVIPANEPEIGFPGGPIHRSDRWVRQRTPPTTRVAQWAAAPSHQVSFFFLFSSFFSFLFFLFYLYFHLLKSKTFKMIFEKKYFEKFNSFLKMNSF